MVPYWLIAMLTLGPLLFYASWPWIWSDTWRRMRPELEATGLVDGRVVDEARAYLDSPLLAEVGPGMALAWGRREG